RRRIPQAYRKENQGRRGQQRKHARHVRPEETISNVVLRRRISPIRPINEEAGEESDTGLLLPLSANNLPITLHSVVQRSRPFPRRRDPQLHCLRNRWNSIAERLLKCLPVRNSRG